MILSRRQPEHDQDSDAADEPDRRRLQERSPRGDGGDRRGGASRRGASDGFPGRGGDVERAPARDRRRDAAPHRRRQAAGCGHGGGPAREGRPLQGVRLDGRRARPCHAARCDLSHGFLVQARARSGGDDPDRGGTPASHRRGPHLPSGVPGHAGCRARGARGPGRQPPVRGEGQGARAPPGAGGAGDHYSPPADAHLRAGQRGPGLGGRRAAGTGPGGNPGEPRTALLRHAAGLSTRHALGLQRARGPRRGRARHRGRVRAALRRVRPHQDPGAARHDRHALQRPAGEGSQAGGHSRPRCQGEGLGSADPLRLGFRRALQHRRGLPALRADAGQRRDPVREPHPQPTVRRDHGTQPGR